MKSCFLFGHSICPENLLPHIQQAIEENYVNLGIRTFYVGNRGQFDRLAAKAARQAKRYCPELHLVLLLSYHPAERAANAFGFDSSYFPPIVSTPRKYAIVEANRNMIRAADSIICFVKHPGNARNLLAYAQKQKHTALSIKNLAEQLS